MAIIYIVDSWLTHLEISYAKLDVFNLDFNLFDLNTWLDY